jgi:hypothetical protein
MRLLLLLRYLQLFAWARRNGFRTRPRFFLTREQAISAYIGLLDREAELRGKDGWVDKTPSHLHYVRTLRARVDDARFLFCVREGLPCIRSLEKVLPGWRRSFDEQDRDYAIARWLSDTALSHLRADPRDSFTLVYEQLLREPDATLDALFAAFGLSRPVIDASNPLSRHAAQVIDAQEHWKSPNRDAAGIVARPADEVEGQALEALQELLDALR